MIEHAAWVFFLGTAQVHLGALLGVTVQSWEVVALRLVTVQSLRATTSQL